MLTTTALEGAIVVARASRDVKPLDVVHNQLRALLRPRPRKGNPAMTDRDAAAGATEKLGNRPPASSASATAASRSSSTAARSPRSAATRPTPASQGYTCEKALRLDHYQNGRSRLTHAAAPPRRRQLEEIDWDTAIAEVAAGFAHRATPTAARRSSTTAAAGRGTTSAAPTAAHSARRSARTTARTRSRRRRPASSGSTRSSSAGTPAATSSTPRSRCSSARTRGCRTASRAPAWCSRRSPRTRTAR